jgi:hypothetical protein
MNKIGMLAAVVIVTAGCNQGGGKAHTRGAGTAAVGTTVTAGSLVEARVGHTATRVDDGMSVLITGGETLTARATATAELWRAGQCTPLPSGMLAPRAGHRAVTLKNGDVWIIGGRDVFGQRLRSTEVWSPTTREFTPGPELRAPRVEAAIGFHDGGVVIAFGQGEDSIELWSWDLKPGKTIDFDDREGRRGDDVASFEGNRLYLAGGTLDDHRPAPPIFVDLNATGRAARTAAPGAEQVQGGELVVGTLDGGSVEGLVVGGRRHGELFKRVQRVRMGDEDVTLIPSVTIATPRERGAAVALPIGIVVAGGVTRGGATTAVEVLDASGSTPAPALVVARYDLEGTLLADGSVLFTGGRGADDLPVGLVELLVARGGDAPDADGLYADARAQLAAWEALVAERDAAVANVARLQGELATATTDLATERAEIARLQSALATAQQKTRDLEAEIATLTTAVARSQAEQDAQRAKLTAARKELATAQGSVSGLQAQVAAAEGRASALQATRDQLRRELDLANGKAAQPAPSGSNGPRHPSITKTGGP